MAVNLLHAKEVVKGSAILGSPGNGGVGHRFRWNPATVEWGWTENIASFDTLGGRVMQLLAVQVTDMTITGQAGTREEMRSIAKDLDDIAAAQARSQQPVELRIPSRGWVFLVYPRHMPMEGWDVATVDYPYQISFAVDDDLGLKTSNIMGDAIKRLKAGVGYSPKWHGGDVGYLRNVASKASASSGTGGTRAAPKTAKGGSRKGVPGPLGAVGAISNPATIPQLLRLVAAVLPGESRDVWAIMVATALCESSGNLKSYNPNATNAPAYGLFQQNEGFGKKLWDPWVAARHMSDTVTKSASNPALQNEFGANAKYAYWGCGPAHGGGYRDHIDAVNRVLATMGGTGGGGRKNVT